MISKIFELLLAIFDNIPSRRERLLNRINEIKHELKEMQQKPWTDELSVKYYTLSSELSDLEKRAANIK